VNPDLNGGVGSWGDLDTISGGIYLNTGTKSGYVFSGTLAGSPLGLSEPNNCNAGHEWYQNAGQGTLLCSHGCATAVVNAGPNSTKLFPALLIVDPADVAKVVAGDIEDYAPNPNVINLDSTFGIQTAPEDQQGAARNISGFYYDPVRRYLFLAAKGADTTHGNSFRETLIHVFEVAQ